MPAPPPVLPRPGLSPPEGDIASSPLPPLVGNPTFDPGWLEMTAPALDPLPPVAAGAVGTPTSIGAPSPGPLRPEPEPLEPFPLLIEAGGGMTLLATIVPPGAPLPPPLSPVPPPAPESDGGGGTTLGMPRVGAVEAESARFPEPPATPDDGGGAITFEPRDVPAPFRLPRELVPELTATEGGGGTTLVASEVPLVPLVPVEFTVGGGGTTSLAPKILPTRLLSNDPLPDCVGGGGTTVFEGSGTLPLGRWRKSC